SGKTRRTFLRTLPVLPVAAAPVAAIAAPEQQQPPDASSKLDDALAETVQLRYGAYLQPGDMEEIKRGIARMQRSAVALAQVKTTNGDAPDFLFHPADTPE